MTKQDAARSVHVDYLEQAEDTAEHAIHDMVFGEMTENSPNYRNVMLHGISLFPPPF